MTGQKGQVAKVTGILAIEMTCVQCDTPCENASGSQMIDASDYSVRCPSCGFLYQVPTGAFDVSQLHRSNKS